MSTKAKRRGDIRLLVHNHRDVPLLLRAANAVCRYPSGHGDLRFSTTLDMTDFFPTTSPCGYSSFLKEESFFIPASLGGDFPTALPP